MFKFFKKSLPSDEAKTDKPPVTQDEPAISPETSDQEAVPQTDTLEEGGSTQARAGAEADAVTPEPEVQAATDDSSDPGSLDERGPLGEQEPAVLTEPAATAQEAAADPEGAATKTEQPAGG